jgi:hypothetical protein
VDEHARSVTEVFQHLGLKRGGSIAKMAKISKIARINFRDSGNLGDFGNSGRLIDVAAAIWV